VRPILISVYVNPMLDITPSERHGRLTLPATLLARADEVIE
jgi:hypothetical protein